MKTTLSLALIVTPLIGGIGFGQQEGGVGPDIAVSGVGSSVNEYPIVGSERSYSISTTSCNVGTERVDWFSGIGNDHPVIAQNMFRIYDGRVEQLGYSFLKHGFFALSTPGCTNLPCQGTNGSELGVGCADTYGAGLNDGNGGSSKMTVNPIDGTYQGFVGPIGNSSIRGRLRVPTNELSTPGAVYGFEVQYVSNEDAQESLARNSVSYRYATTGNPSNIGWSGSTVRFKTMVEAWADNDNTVTVVEIENTDETSAFGGLTGHYVLGYKTTDLGGGQWRYEYALQNLNSDQGVRSFQVPIDCGVTITDVTFRDVDRHSGDENVYSNTDWAYSETAFARWETSAVSTGSQANPLLWGELFNFGFTADSAPVDTVADMDLFRPGNNVIMSAAVQGPCEGSGVICGASSYCTSGTNSSGGNAMISNTGSISYTANNLTLNVISAAPNQPLIFYYGPDQISVPFHNGTRCVGGSASRLNPPVFTDFFGDASRAVDLLAPPTNGGPGLVTPGSTHNFQGWFRDPNAGGAGIDLSDGLSITFCP